MQSIYLLIAIYLSIVIDLSINLFIVQDGENSGT